MSTLRTAIDVRLFERHREKKKKKKGWKKERETRFISSHVTLVIHSCPTKGETFFIATKVKRENLVESGQGSIAVD